MSSNKQINDELLKAFKELRQKLARKRKVPAYIIFSDSTLLDMCQKMPKSREEFLEVSGVGDVKLNDFGDDFLAIINQFELRDFKIEESPKGNFKYEKTKILSLDEVCEYVKKNIQITEEELTISCVAEQVKFLLLSFCNVKITPQKITNYLCQNGYLEIVTENGKNTRVPTIKGEKIGIKLILKHARNGDLYKQNIYNAHAQEFIIKNLKNILNN